MEANRKQEIIVKDREGKDFFIRQLQSKDSRRLGVFFESLSQKTVEKFHPHPLTREFAKKICRKALLRHSGVRAVMFKARTSKVVGYAFVNRVPIYKNAGYLGIALLDNYQGRGLGLPFMQTLLSFSRNKGIKEVYLNVYEKNKAAIELYKKIKFKKFKIHPIVQYLIFFKELYFNYGLLFISKLLSVFSRRAKKEKSIWMRITLNYTKGRI